LTYSTAEILNIQTRGDIQQMKYLPALTPVLKKNKN